MLLSTYFGHSTFGKKIVFGKKSFIPSAILILNAYGVVVVMCVHMIVCLAIFMISHNIINIYLLKNNIYLLSVVNLFFLIIIYNLYFLYCNRLFIY